MPKKTKESKSNLIQPVATFSNNMAIAIPQSPNDITVPIKMDLKIMSMDWELAYSKNLGLLIKFIRPKNVSELINRKIKPIIKVMPRP